MMNKSLIERDKIYKIAQDQVSALRKAIALSPIQMSDDLIHDLRINVKNYEPYYKCISRSIY